ncbi:phage tail-collar fiber domain-containing protein [Salmonella enterica subsp. enterica serovar Corvallis]
MATKYLALLTNIGAAKLAKATALGTKVEITQLAVGDGNGVLPTPNPAQTALVHELRRAPLNMLTVDPANASQIIAEQVIPEDVGGWWIREIGLFDKDGDMVAIANCAETYKPQLQEGSGRVQVIRVILIVSSTEAVTLKIDPAVVLATRQYVDNKIIEVKSYADGLMRTHEQSRNHPDATTTAKGFTQLNSSVTDDSEAQAATPKAVKIAMDNANARLAKDRNLADLPNPALARQNLQLGNSSTKNTGTTANTVAAGDDARITGAMQKSQNGADIPDVAQFLQNLGINEIINPSKRVSIGALGTGVFDGSKPAINIGDSDSGFVFESDGVIGVYANSQKIAELTNTEYKIIGNLSLTNGALLLGGLTHFIRHTDADDAGFAGNNVEIGSWNGIGLTCTYDGTTRIYFNTRTGEVGLKGPLKADGNVYSGDAWLDQTGNVQGSLWGSGVGLKGYLDNTFNKKNTASLDTNGWHRDESTGLITQWGLIDGANGTYNFPRGFPNQCFAVLVTNTSTQGSGVDNAFGYPISNNQFIAGSKNDGGGVSPYPVAFLAFGR